jgi:biopolymer transport protein ExbD
VKVDLPVNDPRNQTPPVDPQKNKIIIDAAGTVSWNGTPVDEVTLRQYLDTASAINPEPELHFQPDPAAKYEKVDQTLAVIKRSAVTKLGFIGNEQYRNDF